MKKIVLITLLISICFPQSLFISEYIEGSSYNKAIEIYNPTSIAVNLTGYELWKISNGGDWAEGAGNNLVLADYATELSANSVLVICSNQAWDEVLAICDISIGGQTTNFNGDDAVGLAYNGSVIDAIGEEGDDIGDGWEVSGVSDATKEHTLVRNLSVTEGNADWATSSANEWTVFGQNTFDYLGSHGELGDISGCMDPDAANYNPNATEDDGSCLYPSAATLYEIQYTTTASGTSDLDCYPSPLVGQIVTVSGVVNAVKSGDYPNFFIQNPTSTTGWEGAYVYDTSVSPSVGDEVELTLSVEEYYGVTELKDVTNYSIVNQGIDITPINLSTGSIGLACNESGEQYEGMLIQLNNAAIQLTDEFGAWYVDDGSGMTLIDDYFFNGDDWPNPSMGELFTSITGVVHYAYGEYRIYPRSISDLAVDLTLPMASAGDDQIVSPGDIVTLDGSASSDPNGTIIAYEWVQTAGPNVTLSNSDQAVVTFTPTVEGELAFRLTVWDNDINESSDDVNVSVVVIQETSIYEIQYSTDSGGESDCYISPFLYESVTVTGTVSAVKPGTYPNFFIEDMAYDQWAGIYVYDSNINPTIGDNITLTAEVDEYYGVTQLIDVTFYNINGSGSLVNISNVSTGALGLTCSDIGEAYEGMLVSFSGVTVESVNEFNSWYVNDGTGTSKVDDYFFDGNWPTPSDGDSYPTITGVVHMYYDEYVIYPRNVDDFDEVVVDCMNDGDINSDGIVNILDIVGIVSYVLGQSNFDECQTSIADLNSDGTINILDIVGIVNMILG